MHKTDPIYYAQSRSISAKNDYQALAEEDVPDKIRKIVQSQS